MTSVYIVGNCHLFGMVRGFKFFDSALLIEGCHVTELSRQFADVAAFVAHASRFNHVLTYAFGEEFLPGLTSSTIMTHVPQAALYPTVTFGAFHPDIVYLFKRDGSLSFLPSPLGPFQSALALYGYFKGYDVARTVALFTAATYERLGYLTVWDAAVEEMVQRAGAKEFDLAHLAKQWLRHGCFMHNPQHPKASVVCDIARTTMTNLGIVPKHAMAASFIPDDLIVGAIWPVYPEVGLYYGLPGSYTFKRPSGDGRWPEHMTLDEFVCASYECFGSHNLADYYCERVEGWLATGVEL